MTLLYIRSFALSVAFKCAIASTSNYLRAKGGICGYDGSYTGEYVDVTGLIYIFSVKLNG